MKEKDIYSTITFSMVEKIAIFLCGFQRINTYHADGGAIQALSRSIKLNISECWFFNCSAESSGGCICFRSNMGGSLCMDKNCAFQCYSVMEKRGNFCILDASELIMSCLNQSTIVKCINEKIEGMETLFVSYTMIMLEGNNISSILAYNSPCILFNECTVPHFNQNLIANIEYDSGSCIFMVKENKCMMNNIGFINISDMNYIN